MPGSVPPFSLPNKEQTMGMMDKHATIEKNATLLLALALCWW